MLNFVSAGLSLASGLFGKSSAKKAAKRKAQQIRAMADYNARVKRMEAKSVMEVSKYETRRSYKQRRRALATQRAAYAKTGAVTGGTPMSVMIEQAMETDIDIQNQRRNRLMQAQTLEQEAKGIKYKGEMGAQTAIEEGRAAGRASLLSGIQSSVGFVGAGMAGIASAKESGNYDKGSWWKY
jgi:hypothetical protein